ncbi:hypothetical protein X777_10831 [Ooceraea biroi]|uniref:Uncharacterized protein n=1 Tax=Ooceraea biroi TaxID=2015173 RepID=A0A026W587_OOCBI|nr:hypothetical protein X777_10831 [Ooceraea biroi]
MLEGEEQRLTETFAYLGIHAGKAFVGTLQDPGLLHVNTRHCLESDCENSKETVERDIVNTNRNILIIYLCLIFVKIFRVVQSLNYECVKRMMGRRCDEPMVSMEANVTIIIGGTKRHWPNWRRSAERFAFGVAVQLCAATRDFPMHDHLHASQTPKGCSFTGATAAATAIDEVGVTYRTDDGWRWMIAATTPLPLVRGRERLYIRCDSKERRVGAHIAAAPKQTYDLDRPNRFLVGSLPGNRLPSSYANGASYCQCFARPMPPIDRYPVNL